MTLRSTSTETLQALLDLLDTTDAEAPLAVEACGQAVTGGYHVTELTLARIDAIDCGGRISHREEATMEVMAGRGGRMPVGIFVGLGRKSMTALPGLADLPLTVALDDAGGGMRHYSVGARMGDAGAVLELTPRSAVCRPMVEGCARTPSPAGCCA